MRTQLTSATFFPAILGTVLAFIAPAEAADRVMVYGQHVGSQIVYNYRVVNNGPNQITRVWLGWDSQNDNNPANDGPELATLPSGWGRDDFGNWVWPASSYTTPAGWAVNAITQEETRGIAIEFGRANVDDYSSDLPPGQTRTGLSVTLDKPDNSYLASHAEIFYGDRYPGYLTVPIERLDTTPPTLSVSVSPTSLQAPAGTLVTVAATITVKDDYDPAPEIKLESITANEPLAAGDITDAVIGTDDRQFQLRDVEVPSGTIGRIYTITYSATDGSGNKSTASVTVSAK